MSIGLVLEGGAMRGMYTAGVLDVFMENEIKVDGIIGVSAGVLFGVNYLSNQIGRAIRYNKRFVKNSNYMGVKTLLSTGNIVNRDFAFYKVPFELDVFDNDTYSKSDIPFYATVTNMNTGKAEYIKIDDVFKQMEVLRASSAMPYVSKVVEIEGEKYLDGGISDSIPVDKCKELGFEKVIVVLTRTLEYRKKKPKEFFAKLKYSKYPNFVKTLNTRYKMYNSTVEKIIDLENKREIFVIRPSRKVKIKRIERDENKLQEMYELGREDCKNRLKCLKEWINS